MSYKLVAYIPENHLETVKEALFAAGAGTQGAYDQCCWQVRGQGQFRPLEGSNPHLGKQDELE
ncbi:MAG: NGG1p interacting factor NIF3, partial [Pseudomonadales bacterium]